MEKYEKFIVLVDDSLIFRNSIKSCLDQYDYQFIEGNNGEEGVQIFKDFVGKISLLIVDLNMPKMNGIKMMEKMTNLSLGLDIPKILITSEPPKNFDVLRKTIPKLKCWIVKPIVEKKFSSVVHKVINDG